MMETYTIGQAIDMLIMYMAKAEKIQLGYGFIRKPIAWALYMTWKWFDEHEGEREPLEVKE